MTAGFKAIFVKFVIFAVITGALLAILYNTMANGLPGGSRGYHAIFSSVSGLAKGDDIRVAGVRVGRVTDIKIVPQGAQVDFDLIEQQPILSNTGMVMRYQSLIGQRYVSLVQPGERGTQLSEGATVPISRTSPGFDLTDLLDGFRPLFQVLQPADVNKLASNVMKVMQGEGGTVESLLKQTSQLTTFLANRDEVFGQVLTNLTPVLNDLAGQGDQLASTVHELKLLMAGLAQDRKAIGKSIDGISTLITSTSDLLADQRQATVQTIKNFRAVATMLQQNLPDLVDSLRAFGTLFGSLGRASSYRNAVNIYLCTAWIKVLGAEQNMALSPADGGPWSEACQ